MSLLTCLAGILLLQTPAPKWPAPLADRKIADSAQVSRLLVEFGRIVADVRKSGATGDTLTDEYLRRLAAIAVREKIGPREFLVAIGVAFDPSDHLVKHPVTRGVYQSFAWRERVELRQPKLRDRHDWLLHFAVSAALAAADPEAAEIMGLLKELQDSLGGSGFSFADLAADYAGVIFAQELMRRPERLADIAGAFRSESFLPKIDDLEEGLAFSDLVRKYGDPESPKFVETCRSIRQRVEEQPIYRTWRRVK